MDYARFRVFIRDIYDWFYQDMIPTLVDLCRWFFLPMGTALREGADRLLVDPSFGNYFINRVIEFVTNSIFNDMPLAVFMLGNAVIIYLTYQIAKFVLDIIF